MAVIHHPDLRAQASVPDSTVSTWRRSGWKSGPLRATRSASQPSEPPSPVGDAPKTPTKEG